jgi:hypothetical protein
MSRVTPLSHGLALMLSLGAVGCGKFREVSACRSVAHEVNAAADEVDALSKAKPVDEARVAKRYAALAKALAPRGAGETPLALAVRDYISVLRGYENALRNHALLLQTPYPRIMEARRELDRLSKREHAAATRIDAECHN